VADLVAAAGGFAPDADPDRLNQAAPLSDGVRVWVPRRGEAEGPAAVNGDGGGAAVGPSPAGGGPTGTAAPVDLNTATLDQLDTLPGIGPSTAQSIIDHRTANGPFRSVDDLLEVRGIGEAKLAQLRDKVRV
jgi:competence protein ComEA